MSYFRGTFDSRMPRGCGEQTMIFAGPNVYAHMYLDAVEILVPNTPPYEASLQRNRDGIVTGF